MLAIRWYSMSPYDDPIWTKFHLLDINKEMTECRLFPPFHSVGMLEIRDDIDARFICESCLNKRNRLIPVG